MVLFLFATDRFIASIFAYPAAKISLLLRCNSSVYDLHTEKITYDTYQPFLTDFHIDVYFIVCLLCYIDFIQKCR